MFSGIKLWYIGCVQITSAVWVAVVADRWTISASVEGDWVD